MQKPACQPNNRNSSAAVFAAALMVFALLLSACSGAADGMNTETAADWRAEQTPDAVIPAQGEAPVQLEGSWIAEADGLALRIDFGADGRFSAAATETAGTVKSYTAEGTYTLDGDALRLSGGNGEHLCTVERTENTMTILQDGFDPLVFERVEGEP